MARVVAIVSGALCGLALVPAVAGAASVRVVEESAGTGPPRQTATLQVDAAAGETNRVVIYRVGEVDGKAEYHLYGSHAWSFGDGCHQGGMGGSVPTTAICLVPLTRPANCTEVGCTDHGREVTIWVALGDGDDSLEMHVPQNDGGGGVFRVVVDAGDGNDGVQTNATHDQIDPGAGADNVEAGFGDDSVEMGSGPDEPDVVDLGRGFDAASYAQRSTSLRLTLNGKADDGAPTERDNLLDVEQVTGGTAGDRIEGSGATKAGPHGFAEELFAGGGSGRDTIIGHRGSDLIGGGLGGGAFRGGAGNDQIQASAGADFATGGADDDAIFLGGGDDRGRGGPGRDGVYGDQGADELEGGAGRDRLDAGLGPFDAPDHATDRLDCGPSQRDRAVNVERRDRVGDCERVRPPPS